MSVCQKYYSRHSFFQSDDRWSKGDPIHIFVFAHYEGLKKRAQKKIRDTKYEMKVVIPRPRCAGKVRCAGAVNVRARFCPHR